MQLQRNCINLAKRFIKTFPVLSLVGPRQAGKTTLAKQLGDGWDYFDLENPNDYNLITNNTTAFFENYTDKAIIDEAQEFPQIFKVLRGVVDANRDQKGRYIVTGSSSPLLTEHLSDSLAGRVGIINVRTLKANELYSKPLSNFYDIFQYASNNKEIKTFKPALTNQEMRHCWLYGGYPEPLINQDQQFFLDWMHNYQSTYINRDLAKLFPRLDKRAYQRFLFTLSSLSGTIINKSDLGRAIEVSEGSIREYLQIAEETFIWRNIYYAANSQVKSIVKRPKGYICDSGLLHYLQRISNMDSLLLSPHVGHSFESFVIEEIIKGIESLGLGNINYSYYRTRKGSEVDFIVDCPGGHIPIEIKMSGSATNSQLQTLNKYVMENNLPFGLLINQSKRVFWLSDKILQIPVGAI